MLDSRSLVFSDADGEHDTDHTLGDSDVAVAPSIGAYLPIAALPGSERIPLADRVVFGLGFGAPFGGALPAYSRSGYRIALEMPRHLQGGFAWDQDADGDFATLAFTANRDPFAADRADGRPIMGAVEFSGFLWAAGLSLQASF